MGRHVTMIDLNATDNASPVVQGAVGKIGGYLKQLQKEERASGEMALARTMRSGEGLAGALGASMGIAGAGLGVLAIGQISEALHGMSEKVSEIKKNWNEIDGSERVAHIAEAIPIIGQITTGVESLVSIWGGEAEKIDLATEAMKRQASYAKEMKTIAEQVAEIQKQGTSYRRRAAEAEAEVVLGHKPGEFDARRGGVEDEFEENRDKLNARQKAIDEQLKMDKYMKDSERASLGHESEDIRSNLQDLDRWKAAENKRIDVDEKNERKKTTQEMMEDRRKAQLESLDATESAQSDAHVKELQANGDFLGAELAQIHEQYSKRLDALKGGSAERLALLAAEAADEAEARKKSANEAADHAAGIDKQLAAAHIEALKSEAAAGNLNAGIEARRLEIQQQFNQKREDLQKILRDEKATAAEKAQAQSLLGGLAGQEAAEQARRGMLGPVAMNTANISARGSGAISRAREENSQTAQLLRTVITETQRSNTLLSLIAGTMHDMSEIQFTPIFQGMA